MTTINYNLPAGTLLKGKNYNYEITGVLGQGSFGITYEAQLQLIGDLGELSTKTTVSIKEFFMENFSVRGEENDVYAVAGKELYDYYMRKFWEEALKLSGMAHPGIVKVLELFSQHGTYYYVMEYLPGGTLNARVKDSKPLTLREILDYTEKIAYALKYMHEHEHPMLHLDLKPDNIMLNADNSPVLIDFGLAKHFDKDGNAENSTAIGLGTPGYAPLEQSEYQGSEGIKTTMDVYALGATLYKLLTGKTPPTAAVLLNKPNLLEYNLKQCQVPDPFIELVIHAMQLRSIERTADMNVFLNELEVARKSIPEGIISLAPKRLTDVASVKPEQEDIDPDDEETVLPDEKDNLQPGVKGDGGSGNIDKKETSNNSGSDVADADKKKVSEVADGDNQDAGNADGEGESVNINRSNEKIGDNRQEEESVNDESNNNEDSGGTGLSVGDVIKPDTLKTRLMKYKKHLLAGGGVLAAGICLLFLFQRDTPEEKFRQAEAHYSAGEYGQAVTLFTELAQDGHAPSQWYLGKCNETGLGVEANASTAFNWYMKAAEQGYDKATFDVALCYEKGIGTDVDEDKAMKWYAGSANDAAKRALERMTFHLEVKQSGMEVVLNSENNDSCRITSVTLDYENMGNRFSVSYPISDSKSVRILPKGNCDIIFTYQYKNRPEKRDSISFDFNTKLEQMIIDRNKAFIGHFFPTSREIVVWLSENEGYNEVPTLDYLNSILKRGYTIQGFTPMKQYTGQSLEDVMDYRKSDYNPIEELYLRKK